MRTRSYLVLALLAGSAACLPLACSGGDGGSGGGELDSGSDSGPSDLGLEASDETGDDGGLIVDASGCSASSECDGGVCLNGSCCASAASVCGTECCAAGAVCLFQKCVTPGKTCFTGNDCPTGQYCETALGGGGTSGDGGVDAPSEVGDAGAGDGGDGGSGPLCTTPQIAGRCVDRPPLCPKPSGDAGSEAGSDTGGGGDAADAGGSCIEQCEYHPSATGPLKATAKWSWGAAAVAKPGFIDVWATPTVARIYDGNCDGKVDELDAPSVVFVSGKAIDNTTGKGTCCQCNGGTPTACHTGVLRNLDGRTGKEIWSLDKASPTSSGFAGLSTALGDVDGDGHVDVVAATGEGYVVLIDANGKVLRQSDKPIPGNADNAFGWGGGLAIADIDNDGFPEIGFGATVFTTTAGAITLKWTGTAGIGGGGVSQALSTFADVDGAADNHLELVAGHTTYKADGTILWNRTDLPDGFPGVADFDADGKPDVVLVSGGKAWILEGATGVTKLGPVTLPGTGSGGAPTIADFDGDGKREFGVAMATYYAVLKPNFTAKTIDVLWKTPNHDLSSSVTGSSVFDFEGDGKAEVIYNDECFLWVFDGTTGAVRFAAPTSSFTGTEASVVADVDGDGRAEILMISNAADPSSAGWGCMDATGTPVTVNGVKWTKGPGLGSSYRGITAYGDVANAWVGTRTLWSEHTYHVSNICDDRDSACSAPNKYGAIPKLEQKAWTLPWLNDFRQNVQDKGIFDAPNATVSLEAQCSSPVQLTVSLRNVGLASLPAGVDVAVNVWSGATKTQLGKVTSTRALLPGQTEQMSFTVDAAKGNKDSIYSANVLIDPAAPKFQQCRADDDDSGKIRAACTQ
jgi:hypothetical protein